MSVETKEGLDILLEIGIELVQGYYFAKPSEIPMIDLYLQV